MDHAISRQDSLLQPHSQVMSSASASSDQSPDGVPPTATNDGSTNGTLALANDSQAFEMANLDDGAQHIPPQYSTELK